MVTELARWVLAGTKVDPLKVANIWEIEENECWEYLIDLQRELNQQDKERDSVAIQSEAREWANLLPEAYETKRLILLERLKSATTEKEKKERLIHYKLFTNKLDTISPEQIERARNYPLKDLLGTNKNITNCPFHDDRTASLNIKNNFFHCHGCGISGDVLAFYMKTKNASFREAVLKLT